MNFSTDNRAVIRAGTLLLLLFAPAGILVSCPSPNPAPGIFHCYLTWQGDTSTTITVNYHTALGATGSSVFYDAQPRGGDPSAYTFSAWGKAHTVPALGLIPGADRLIHVVELKHLIPGATYYFIAGSELSDYSEEMKFRTVPSDGTLRFVTGGDMGTDEIIVDLLSQAAALDPMFALIGGDIAYANGERLNWERWDTWLDNWEQNMITPDGRLVPMILAIGNHEVKGSFYQTASPANSAPFYFSYFAQEEQSYFARQLGPSVRLFVLDSNHVSTSFGPQRDWLEAELSATPPGIQTMALYHVPMYPSHRPYPGFNSRILRDSWLNLFDDYDLDIAFENHDHMHKRTKRLRNNAPDPTGTLYLGDGCFGRTPREGSQAQRLEDLIELDRLGLSENYLAAWSSTRHFWAVEIDSTSGLMTFDAIDSAGVNIDSTVMLN